MFCEATSSKSFDYSWALGEDYLTLGTSDSARYQPELGLSSSWVNQLGSVYTRNVSPRFSIFRFHTYGELIRRNYDLNHNLEVLGTNFNLRGFPTGYLSGSNLWDAHFELRTEPWIFHTIHLGTATFVDLGDTFDDPHSIMTFASAGFGLRAVFPQFNTSVLRVDVGFPFESLNGQTPSYLSATFGQAF